MTTCPSGVDYMHLVDHARVHIEKTYKRPLTDRLLRALLASVLPYPGAFPRRPEAGAARPAVRAAAEAGAFAEAACAPCWSLRRHRLPAPSPFARRASTRRRASAAAAWRILTGCAQPVLDPGINEATIRLLTRLGVEVVVPEGEGCCGALVHHMGREAAGA